MKLELSVPVYNLKNVQAVGVLRVVGWHSSLGYQGVSEQVENKKTHGTGVQSKEVLIATRNFLSVAATDDWNRETIAGDMKVSELSQDGASAPGVDLHKGYIHICYSLLGADLSWRNHVVELNFGQLPAQWVSCLVILCQLDA
jgi:hypothetical protein